MASAADKQPQSAPELMEPSQLKEKFRTASLGQSEQPECISWPELRRLLLVGNPDFPEKHLAALFKEFGTGKDAGIDFDNFVDSCFGAQPSGTSLSKKGLAKDDAKSKAPKPLHVLIVCDPGPDPDDCKVLLVAAYLQRQGALVLKGVICNGGHQAKERAKLAKTVLRAAGLPDVPVGVGSAGEPRSPQPHEYLIEGYDKVRDEDLENGESVMLSVLRNSQPKSLCVQVQAGMTDVARIMQEEKDLFLAKVAAVAVQAGLKSVDESSFNSEVALHHHGWTADSSQNNVYDLSASEYMFGFCFDNGVEMRVVSRLSVPGIPMALADRFAENGYPVLRYLANCQRSGLVGLWQKVCTGSGVPPHCSKEWFFATFCGVSPSEYTEKFIDLGLECDIAKHLKGTVNPYDLVAFMTLLPGCAPAFDFDRAAVVVNDVQHYLFLQKENMVPVDAIIDLLTSALTDISKL